MSNPFPKADPNIDGELLAAARKVRCYELAKTIIVSEQERLKAEGLPTLTGVHELRMLGRFAQLLFEVACGSTSLVPNGVEQDRARELLEEQKITAGGQILKPSKYSDINMRVPVS